MGKAHIFVSLTHTHARTHTHTLSHTHTHTHTHTHNHRYLQAQPVGKAHIFVNSDMPKKFADQFEPFKVFGFDPHLKLAL